METKGMSDRSPDLKNRSIRLEVTLLIDRSLQEFDEDTVWSTTLVVYRMSFEFKNSVSAKAKLVN
ncbi:MAG TPA: hypothetical protein DDZ73_13500 [Gammaproteobacteria bacterium]|nr:hypothetical protein [Gammaproteobacteria bacterium]